MYAATSSKQHKVKRKRISAEQSPGSGPKTRSSNISLGAKSFVEVVDKAADIADRPDIFCDIPTTLQWAVKEKQRSKLIRKSRELASIDTVLCYLATFLAVLDIEFSCWGHGISILNLVIPFSQSHSSNEISIMRPACRATLLRTSRITPEQYFASQSSQELNYTRSDLDGLYRVEYRLAAAYDGAIDREWREMQKNLAEDYYGETMMFSKTPLWSQLIWYLISFITVSQICFRFEVCDYKTQLENLDNVIVQSTTWTRMLEVFRDSALLLIHYHSFLMNADPFWEPYFVQLKLMVVLKKFMLIPNRTRIASIIATKNYGTEKNSLKWNAIVPSFMTTDRLVTGLSGTMIMGWYMIFANEREYGICIGPMEAFVIVVKSLFGNTSFVSQSYLSNCIQILVLFNGFLFMAYMVDSFSRKRQFSLETRKLVASHEYRICTSIMRESAAALIQAMWKSRKSYLYLKWKRLQDNLDNDNDTRDDDEMDEPLALHTEIQAALNTKLWNWRKLKRDAQTMQKALDYVLDTDFECPTVEDICCDMSRSESLSKRHCEPMPYDYRNKETWDNFCSFMKATHEGDERVGTLDVLCKNRQAAVRLPNVFSRMSGRRISLLRKGSNIFSNKKTIDVEGCKIIQSKGHKLNLNVFKHVPKHNIGLSPCVSKTGLTKPVIKVVPATTADQKSAEMTGNNSEIMALLKAIQTDVASLRNEIGQIHEDRKIEPGNDFQS